MFPDIYPKSELRALRKSSGSELGEAFPVSIVAPVVGMSSSFISKNGNTNTARRFRASGTPSSCFAAWVYYPVTYLAQHHVSATCTKVTAAR